MRKNIFESQINSENKVTVGIVSAYSYHCASEDLQHYCNLFGLKEGKITIKNADTFQQAQDKVTLMWRKETAVDIQLLRFFSPDAEIICYLSRSENFCDLFHSITEADKCCDIVLLSFGTAESKEHVKYEEFFSKSNTLYICAMGNLDGVFYPASSAYTISVGAIEKQSTAESRFMKHKDGTHRTIPDIRFFSGGEKGAPFYCTYGKGWENAKGTSVAAACIAGICAMIAEKDKTILRKKQALLSLLRSVIC